MPNIVKINVSLRDELEVGDACDPMNVSYNGNYATVSFPIQKKTPKQDYFLPPELAKEYEQIDYRLPLKDELYYGCSTRSVDNAAYDFTQTPQIIVRKKPIMPAETEVTVKIKIPSNIAAEYDVIDIRIPKENDSYILKGEILKCALDHKPYEPQQIIVKKKFHFQWPEWLIAAAIAMDSDGTWYAYSDVPEIDNHEWYKPCADIISINGDGSWIKFQLPEVQDWKQSLIINPNRKETT